MPPPVPPPPPPFGPRPDPSGAPADRPYETGLGPADLADGRPRPVSTPWGELALYPLGDGRVVAADCWCPHMQGPLFEGTLADGQMTCPWHRWRYSLEDGRCTEAPQGEDASERLRILPLELGPEGTYRVGPPAP